MRTLGLFVVAGSLLLPACSETPGDVAGLDVEPVLARDGGRVIAELQPADGWSGTCTLTRSGDSKRYRLNIDGPADTSFGVLIPPFSTVTLSTNSRGRYMGRWSLVMSNSWDPSLDTDCILVATAGDLTSEITRSGAFAFP